MEARGLVYVPLDVVEWVWSKARRAWMQNVVVDLRGSPYQIWLKICLALQLRGVSTEGLMRRVLMVWMSPPCRTFSRVDASNRSRGWGYRDHHKRSRPPLKTVRGRLAKDHDELVKEWLAFAAHMRRCGAVWFMENPEGSLQRRPYMRRQSQGVQLVMRLVHYCAFGRQDMKPTNVWTCVLSWVPVGTTGDGRCQGSQCHAMVDGAHKASVTGGKRRRGTQAVTKSAVPELLLREIVEHVLASAT